jgi:hypothetical protein
MAMTKEETSARKKEYNSRPDVAAKRRAQQKIYRDSPEGKQKRKEYILPETSNLKKKEYGRNYYAIPEVKERMNKNHREYIKSSRGKEMKKNTLCYAAEKLGLKNKNVPHELLELKLLHLQLKREMKKWNSQQ